MYGIYRMTRSREGNVYIYENVIPGGLGKLDYSNMINHSKKWGFEHREL